MARKNLIANLTKSSVLKKNDALLVYSAITSSCTKGVKEMLESQGKTKDEYTISEMLELSDLDAENGAKFREFFADKD